MTITQIIRAFGSRLHDWDTPRPRAKNWNKYGWSYWNPHRGLNYLIELPYVLRSRR